MIRITITHRTAETPNSIRMEGHAGYNPGNDIVCAAVSGLTEQLGCYLLQHDNTADVRMLSGDAAISSINPFTDLLFDLTEFGLRCIAQTYPDHVKVLPVTAQ